MNTATPLRALTIRQPYGFAVAEGFKPIENRTRRTHYRGPILIHTSKVPEQHVSIVQYSRDAAARLDQLGGRGNFWDALMTIPSRLFKNHPTLALRGIVATARITGCHRVGDGCGPDCAVWGQPDTWHWEITDAKPLDTAIGVNGALGLWTPPADVQQAVRDQLATLTEANAR